MKPKTTLRPFSPEDIAAALAAAPVTEDADAPSDWQQGIVTPGGGIDATRKALRQAREAPGTTVTVRYSPEVVAYFKVTGKGWQARMDAALREWIAAQRN